ncbi:MAG: hypothetical protein ACOYLB_03830 [Phototrophicaceae bacterium]
MSLEQIGLWVGFILTLFVYSYVIGDSIFYRLAVYIFAGLTAGLVAIITWDSVIMPWLSLMNGGNPLVLMIVMIPIVLASSLMLRPVPIVSGLRKLTLAFIIGVGAAVAVVGQVSGTLIPIMLATGTQINRDLVGGLFGVLVVVSVLLTFHHTANRPNDQTVRQSLIIRGMGWLGSLFIALTMGTLYGSALVTALTIFTQRVGFMLEQIRTLMGS